MKSNRKNKTTRNHRNETRRPRTMFESLEDRRLMAADIDFADGILTIQGDSQNDWVEVQTVEKIDPLLTTIDKHGPRVEFYKVWVLEVQLGHIENRSDTPEIYETTFDLNWEPGVVESIVFQGAGGNDEFYNYTDVVSHLNGGAGNDELHGGSVEDYLNGGSGVDFLFGHNGDDLIVGGWGTDKIYGGQGKDGISEYVWGNASVNNNSLQQEFNSWTENDSLDSIEEVRLNGSSNDNHMNAIAFTLGNVSLYGNAGKDVLIGGTHGNYLSGGSDADKLYGNGSIDKLYGNRGDDTLYGGTGNDWLYGGAGQDVLYGGGDNDTLKGGYDDDLLYGEQGDDHLYGGRHNDIMFGGGNNDTLYGSTGADVLYGDAGQDVLYGGENNDTLYGSTGNDWLYGDAGQDVLHGGGNNDTLKGGDDDDWLYGEQGVDYLYGEQHDDILFGGSSTDFLYGGGNNDTLYGGTGADVLYGNAGQDVLHGGENNDTLYGSTGNDTLYGDAGQDVLYGGEHIDTLKGGSGDDLLYGGQGVDYLHGEQHDDIMFGGSGGDFLYGGTGHDQLLGGADSDWLEGNPGNDGLFGGSETDMLLGGGDMDRYLYEVEDWMIGYSNDTDVKIVFQDTTETTTITYDGTDHVYTAASWSDEDVQVIDEAFAVLQKKQGNNTLLRLSDGSEMTYLRLGATTSNFSGWNSDGVIKLSDKTFSDGDNWTHQTIYHEVGHNWETTNPDWDGFKDLSGWTETDKSADANFVLSTNGDWYHETAATFARDYGKTNPKEDFATSFSAYFMDESGETYSGDGATNIPDKIDFIDDFLDDDAFWNDLINA